MKHLKIGLLAVIILICASVNGQVAFEKSYDFYINSWSGLVFVQDDGYLVPTYGAVHDRYYLCLIKTNLNGDTLWTKEYDYGDLKYVGLSATQDADGNIYLQSGDYQQKIIKFDKDGNELWVRPYSGASEHFTTSSDGFLWMAVRVNDSNYLYKIDALSGDSLNRYLISNIVTECTSIVVTAEFDVVITLTIRNHAAGTMYTEFYRLPHNTSEIEQFTMNIPTTTFLVHESRVHDDEIICLGEWIEWYNSTYYLIRYKPDGTLISFSTYDFDYYYSTLHNFTVNNNNEVIALGLAENEQGGHIMLKAFSPEGDSLWTYLTDNTSARGIDIKATPDNGYIVAGNLKVGNMYQPYLLKTFRRITLPADSSDIVPPLVTNPARGQVKFDTRQFPTGEILFSNQFGRRVKTIRITGDETTFDCSQMEPGLYLYNIITDSRKISGKVILWP